MYEEEAEQSPSNILPAILRYKWHLAISIPILMAASVFVILMIPPVYRSSGTVMVETQQIPEDLVQSTVTAKASEQIDIIRQRVMTREKLLGVINKYPYFGAENASPLEIERILNSFKDKVVLEVASAEHGRSAVAIGFIVSFGSESPAISQAVTNDLVSLFLSENIRARTMRASETTEFLKAEAAKIREELNKIEATVADYKKENKDSLPEHLDLYIGMREDTRKRISELEQAIKSSTEQLTLLNSQLALAQDRNPGLAGSDAELSALRSEYRRLLIQFKPEHPDVISLKHKIELLESGVSADGSDDFLSAAAFDVNNQVASLQSRIEHLDEERLEQLAKLEDIQNRIIKIPQVERAFVSIKRDYDAKLAQYESIVGKTQSAEMAESLEQQRKAERFTLLEPPIIPTAPAEPDRKKLLVLAMAFSFGFPAGIVFLIGFLDKSIRTSAALEKITGSAPLIEIPYITTREETLKKRNLFMFGAAGAAGALCVGVVFLHFFYMPLDLLAYKVVARFGV